MIVELGHFALVMALFVAIFQMAVPAWGAHVRDPRLMAVAEPAALCQLGLLLVAFLSLMNAYITSDFSVANVAANSHSTKPLLYRISGVWGNHEGSMVLWVLILALFGAAVAAFGRNLPLTLKANVLAVQASVAVAFCLFILLTSNPFLRIDPPPADGQGLNPILQDPALAFHPPFLYTGYVGFSIAYSFAIAALIEGRLDAAWARWVRPWTLAAWMCLTIGIAMGSWWAYYELGWGGFWFWDPVENASFMPWLAGTALLHSALVMEKRDALKVWTILLAILTFSLSLMGTFLVRSGVLTSVHAFAVDPRRGVFILAILTLFTGGGLALFALRSREMRQGGLFAPLSREGSLVLNNILLTTACATVLVGTLYPLVLEALTGAKISVGAPYFNLTFGPLMLPLLIALPFGPFLAWKRGDLLGVAQRLLFAALLAVVVLALGLAAFNRGPVLAPFGLALGAFVMAGAVSELCYRARLGAVPLAETWRRLKGQPRSAFGTTLAHLGVGLIVIFILATISFL
jgi:cytochrome c-type biogenesis protein CcmF